MNKRVEDECPNCEKTVRLGSLKPTLSEGEIAYYECPHCGAQLNIKLAVKGMKVVTKFTEYRKGRVTQSEEGR